MILPEAMLSAAISTVLSESFARRQTVLTHLKDLYRSLKNGNLEILIFGAGGIGKSTLLKHIKGDADGDGSLAEYRVSHIIEKEKIRVSGRAIVRVAPGQPVYQRSEWPQMFEHIGRRTSTIIINVVYDGLHHPGEVELKDLPWYDPSMTDTEVSERYISERKSAELKALAHLQPHIEASANKIYMITLCTNRHSPDGSQARPMLAELGLS